MPSDDSDRRHELLWSIAGEWATSGRVVGEPPVPVSGTDIYEVLPGGHFLVHHVDVTVGTEQVRAIEIIGEPSPESDAFLVRSYDSSGSAEVMELTVDDAGVFHFAGGPDIAPTAQPANATTARVRSTLTVAPDHATMAALWERSKDGVTWEPWMAISFTRTPQPGSP